MVVSMQVVCYVAAALLAWIWLGMMVASLVRIGKDKRRWAAAADRLPSLACLLDVDPDTLGRILLPMFQSVIPCLASVCGM